MRPKLTYANVLATLALFFALGGSAIAAREYLITSTKQISPKVLKTLRGRTGPVGAVGPKGDTGAPGAQGGVGPAGPSKALAVAEGDDFTNAPRTPPNVAVSTTFTVPRPGLALVRGDMVLSVTCSATCPSTVALFIDGKQVSGAQDTTYSGARETVVAIPATTEVTAGTHTLQMKYSISGTGGSAVPDNPSVSVVAIEP
jgi:hypothetical protein